MRIAFVAALATAVQAISVEPFPKVYELSAVDVETEAELQADVEAKLDALVESLCESTIASNAEAFADAEWSIKEFKDKVVSHLKNFATDSELTLGSITNAIADVTKTVAAVGGAYAAPTPATIGFAAKEIYGDFQKAKGFFKKWKKNKNKRLKR